MTIKDAAELLDLLAKKAPGLRKAGLQQIHIDGLATFTIGAAEVPERAAEDEDEDSDPLSDPVTFGRMPKKRANGVRS